MTKLLLAIICIAVFGTSLASYKNYSSNQVAKARQASLQAEVTELNIQVAKLIKKIESQQYNGPRYRNVASAKPKIVKPQYFSKSNNSSSQVRNSTVHDEQEIAKKSARKKHMGKSLAAH